MISKDTARVTTKEWDIPVINVTKFAATQASSLRRHIGSIHEGARYPCFKCEYSATEEISLEKRIMSKHKEVRHPCNKCENATMKKVV